MRRAFFAIAICGALHAQPLKKNEVRPFFDEMAGFHVEHSEMNPVLMKRSYKNFLTSFDPAKMYFTAEQVQPYLKPSQKKLEGSVQEFLKGDLTSYDEMQDLVEVSVSRVRGIRKQVQRELILSADLEPSYGEVFLSYASDEDVLRERIHKEMTMILLEEKKANKMDNWTPSDREKIFALWENRYQRREGSYNKETVALHSMQAIAKSLDAHTAYFTPEEAHEMRTSLEKQFEGVGVILREGIYGVTIADLVKDGPAMKSGKVRIGDKITHIDGKDISKMDFTDVLKAMKGSGSKELKLTLKQGDQVVDVMLVRESILMQEERVQYAAHPYGNGSIGILTLPSFYEGGHLSSAENDMREAIKKLKKEGELKGLILDLRENAGGFLTQAVKIAALFISKGVVVISKYSKGEIKYLRNLDGRMLYNGPLIILTSKASASAAEIVAAALQDYGAALIVGDEQTYGKGSIQYQTVTDKDAKYFYKVTVGRYYTVSGKSTQIEGVKADIVVPSQFASYKLGERYLEYPLPRDQVAAAYIDPLTDIDYRSRSWFQKNYLPDLQKPQDKWKKVLPILKQNSESRLSKDKNFALFLKAQEKKKGGSIRGYKKEESPPWGGEDLQMQEAVNIIKEMISLNQNL